MKIAEAVAILCLCLIVLSFFIGAQIQMAIIRNECDTLGHAHLRTGFYRCSALKTSGPVDKDGR